MKPIRERSGMEVATCFDPARLQRLGPRRSTIPHKTKNRCLALPVVREGCVHLAEQVARALHTDFSREAPFILTVTSS